MLPLVLYGPAPYLQRFELVLSDANRAAFLTNASIVGLAQRAGAGVIGTAASVVLLAWLAAIAWRRAPSPLYASALGLSGAIVASPIAWVHYTLFLLPVFFLLSPTPMRLIAAALLVVPVPLVLRALDSPAWVQATAGSVYTWAVLLCLAALLREHAPACWPPRRNSRAGEP